jgi:tRNA threonylcarbamoyladenosine biosynthesis protein TsaE
MVAWVRDGADNLSAQLPDEAATLRLGAALAKALQPGLRIYLTGELGAGKTTLVRGVLHALGHQGRVKSPSYTLVELYSLSRLYLYHFDFYRFNNPTEWGEAGFRDEFASRAVCMVEWPEKAAGVIPPADVRIELQPVEAGRDVRLIADSEPGRRCLELLIE